MFPRLNNSRLLVVAVIVFALTACGSGGNSSTNSAGSSQENGTSITQPTALNLYPNQSSVNAPKLTVLISAVGNTSVRMPLSFDTGSAGVTLYAPDIFPANMVTSSGFIFPAGQTSMTYNSITVTNVQGTRSYGTLNKTVEQGNLGFAQLTFGDGQGAITTKIMPVFLFYTINGQPNTNPSWQGWFGVASTNGTIEVAGSVPSSDGFESCTTQTSTSCYVVSAFKYLNYGSQVNAGFMLSPATIQTCDISTAGSCSPAAILTVGLNNDVESGFSTTPLTCPPNGYVGPAEIAGYPVCQKFIGNTTVSITGSPSGTFAGDTLFDTGTPYVYLSVQSGNAFTGPVSNGSTVMFTTPSGFQYSYTSTSTDPSYTDVNVGGDGNSILGIQYFLTNYFLVDFTSSIEGWK